MRASASPATGKRTTGKAAGTPKRTGVRTPTAGKAGAQKPGERTKKPGCAEVSVALPVAAPAASPAVPEPSPPCTVCIKYNHYSEMFGAARGRLLWEARDTH